ncbi:hypothetical protein [Methylomonas koyamae]|uniref:hypothetical protein n=1 Tax=Methylomonas koyamae TaxID=702114 RepID=UPI002873C526|nr:hypothetical protein [Methylomonas koyamae]WNB77576.1 hypothetical protein RI210_08330 [Methylomonas koyamae]
MNYSYQPDYMQKPRPDLRHYTPKAELIGFFESQIERLAIQLEDETLTPKQQAVKDQLLQNYQHHLNRLNQPAVIATHNQP